MTAGKGNIVIYVLYGEPIILDTKNSLRSIIMKLWYMSFLALHTISVKVNLPFNSNTRYRKKMNSVQMINASDTKNTRFVLQYQWHTKIPRGKEPVIAVLRRVTLYGYRLTVWQRSILHWWHALEYSEWRLVQDRRRSVDIQPQC